MFISLIWTQYDTGIRAGQVCLTIDSSYILHMGMEYIRTIYALTCPSGSLSARPGIVQITA